MRLLLVEDDPALGAGLIAGPRAPGFAADLVDRGDSADTAGPAASCVDVADEALDREAARVADRMAAQPPRSSNLLERARRRAAGDGQTRLWTHAGIVAGTP